MNVLTKLITLLQFLRVSKAKVEFDTVKLLAANATWGWTGARPGPHEGVSPAQIRQLETWKSAPVASHRRCAEDWELTLLL